jgi:hypothetical protein
MPETGTIIRRIGVRNDIGRNLQFRVNWKQKDES